MSATSSSCWANRTNLCASRLRWRDAVALLALVNGALWSLPLLLPVLLLATPVTVALCCLEWRQTPRPRSIDYDPVRLLVSLDDGALWQANLPVAHGILHDRLALKGQCRGKTCWQVLYRDQMPAPHWRRLQVLVRFA